MEWGKIESEPLSSNVPELKVIAPISVRKLGRLSLVGILTFVEFGAAICKDLTPITWFPSPSWPFGYARPPNYFLPATIRAMLTYQTRMCRNFAVSDTKTDDSPYPTQRQTNCIRRQVFSRQHGIGLDNSLDIIPQDQFTFLREDMICGDLVPACSFCPVRITSNCPLCAHM